jgi:hypothetical protein
MLKDWHPDVLHADPSTPAGLRMVLQARYQHLVLKFTVPPVEEQYKATWIGGKVTADSEDELLRKVLEELQDCGGSEHDWVTRSETRDPNNEDRILRTQGLECVYCDPRHRVITVYSPLPEDGFDAVD